MDLKKIEKAAKLYEKIKKIDAEILPIDKMAQLIALGESKISFELKIEDHKEQKKEDVLDADGSLKNSSGLRTDGTISYITWGGYAPATTVIDNSKKLNEGLTDTVALTILGIILQEKIANRDKLIIKIENLKLA